MNLELHLFRQYNKVNLTSVARLWLAPLASRNLTTLSWFSWAAMYSGVKPFCDWTLTAAPFATSNLTTSSCPAAIKSKLELSYLPYIILSLIRFQATKYTSKAVLAFITFSALI
jgi:hypothetical protein